MWGASRLNLRACVDASIKVSQPCAHDGPCLAEQKHQYMAEQDMDCDRVYPGKQCSSLLPLPACSAEGRYLSAVRDLNMPPVLESTRLSPAAQWKVTGQGISNVMHPHNVCIAL